MSVANTALVLVLSVSGLLLLKLFSDQRNALKNIGFVLSFLDSVANCLLGSSNLPGYRVFYGIASILGNALPRIPGITIGGTHWRDTGHSVFKNVGLDAYSVISAWPKATTDLVLADAVLIKASSAKEVVTNRAKFPKPVDQYFFLTFFGRNIVASEDEEWKRFRKICAPAFSDRNNVLVWNETVQLMVELFEEMWGSADETVVEDFSNVTKSITLFIISIAGFGKRLSWKNNDVCTGGHQMTFGEALKVATTEVVAKLIVPTWAFGLTKHLQQVRLAFEELHAYMLEMVHERKKAGDTNGQGDDLFGGLLEANSEGGLVAGQSELTDDEVIGNIFIFLVAGHETTAHTLSFVAAMLALYPDEQEELSEHIKATLPDGRIPTYQDMPALTYSKAVLFETLRMFPPVMLIPKRSAEDTVFVTTNDQGKRVTIPVPKGSGVNIHANALHYNPKYWDDPERFMPKRFLGDWPKDAFIAFSAGVRSCIGKKFSETESIAVITMLVQRYQITVKEEAEFANETFEERRARVLKAWPGLTLTPHRIPLVFKRRQ